MSIDGNFLLGHPHAQRAQQLFSKPRGPLEILQPTLEANERPLRWLYWQDMTK